MAKRKTSSKKTPPVEQILPVPQTVVEHHLEVLAPKMQQWLETKKVPPVLLFTGPEGIGKRAIIHYLSQWLLCENAGFTEKQELGLFGDSGAAPESSPSLAGCGQCPACQRALNNQWLDFIEVTPEVPDDGRQGKIKVDELRAITASLGHSAHEGAFKIIAIQNAELMTVQAANSLLKILEEPPRGWIFFLTASNTSLLLPTIVSRCQKLALRPLSNEDLESLLVEKQIESKRAKICAQLAQGSWQKAVKYALDDSWERRGSLFRFLHRPQAELNDLVDWAAKEVRNFYLLIDQMELLTSDLVHWTIQKNGQYQWVNQDGAKVMSQYADALSQRFGSSEQARTFWLERMSELGSTRQKLSAPLNRKLLAQNLLMPWMSASTR